MCEPNGYFTSGFLWLQHAVDTRAALLTGKQLPDSPVFTQVSLLCVISIHRVQCAMQNGYGMQGTWLSHPNWPHTTVPV